MEEILVWVNIKNQLLAATLLNVQLMATGALGFLGRNVVRLVEQVSVSVIAGVIILQLSLEVFLVKEKWHRKMFATKKIAHWMVVGVSGQDGNLATKFVELDKKSDTACVITLNLLTVERNVSEDLQTQKFVLSINALLMVLGEAGCPGAIVANHAVVENGNVRGHAILLHHKMVVLTVPAEVPSQTTATMNSVHGMEAGLHGGIGVFVH